MWQIKRIHDQDYAVDVQHDAGECRFRIYMISLEGSSLWIFDQNDNDVICSTIVCPILFHSVVAYCD